jgi:exopolysaccharide production protein ExoZ
LRGIAALTVVGFHFREYLASFHVLPEWVSAAMKFGFFGVDIFFALSGFVVGLSADRAIHSVRDGVYFLLQRFARIFLGYWPALLLLVIAMYAVNRLPNSAFAFVSVFLLSPHHHQNWLNVAWSLTYELYFYLLVGAAFVVTPRAHRRLVLFALIAVVLSWNLSSWVHAKERVFAGEQVFSFLLSALSVEFFAGALLAMTLARGRGAVWPLLTAGLLLIALGLWCGASSQAYADVSLLRASSFGVAGFGTLLAGCALQRTGLPAPKALVKIGDASFSLYLLHPICLYALGYAVRNGYCGGIVSCEGLSVFWLVATIAFALLWFRWLEQPLYAWASEAILAMKQRGQLSNAVSASR